MAALLLVLLASAPSAEEKQLSIYGPRVSYSLPVSEHEGQDYVALLEALEPFGNVSAAAEGAKWKLRFNKLEAEFRQDASVGKVAGQKFGLPGRFVLENGRGLVPLRALPAILGLMLATRTEYHEAGRRLFLGGVATRFTTDLARERAEPELQRTGQSADQHRAGQAQDELHPRCGGCQRYLSSGWKIRWSRRSRFPKAMARRSW